MMITLRKLPLAVAVAAGVMRSSMKTASTTLKTWAWITLARKRV
jgi:hypothetical protein